MKTRTKILISFAFMTLLAVGFFIVPETSRAEQLFDPLGSVTHSEGGEKGFMNLIAHILKQIYTFVIALATLFIVIGGLMYMLSTGNQNRMELAKKMIVYSIMGIAIVFGSAIILREIAIAVSGSDTALSDIFPGAEAILGDGTVPEGRTVVTRIVNFLLASLSVLGAIGIAIGGLWYLASGGDEEKNRLGKQTLIYSIIGLVVAVGSMIIVKQLENLF